MKNIINVVLIALLVSTSYQYGRYKGHKFDELEKCNEKLRQQILTGNSVYIEELKNSPFNVAYYYAMGKVYECAFIKNGNL